MNKTLQAALTIAAFGFTSLTAQAGTFANITIDGDFSDWAGITPIVTDADSGFVYDIHEIYIANNATDVFFRITLYNSVNPFDGGGLFLAIDNDSNPATGFDVFGLGIVGSEGGYQNDFPFQQATGTFNTGAPTDAAILISPFNVVAIQQEFSISLSAIIDTGNNTPLFPNTSFNFAAYFTNAGESDFAGAAPYTFAVPEPSTYGLLGIGLLTVIVFARRSRTVQA